MTVDDRVRHLFTAPEAEKALGIPAGTIRSWVSRELLYSYGLDKRGREMYDRDDLLALERKSKTRARRARHERWRQRLDESG